MTQTLIEKLQELPRVKYIDENSVTHDINGDFILADDLRAIIEQYKTERAEPVACVSHLAGKTLTATPLVWTTDPSSLPGGTKLYTSTSPDIVGELVKALEGCEDADNLYEARLIAGKALTKAKEYLK
jgi:hypothetical protein